MNPPGEITKGFIDCCLLSVPQFGDQLQSHMTGQLSVLISTASKYILPKSFTTAIMQD